MPGCLGCSASAQYGALSVRGVCGGRRLGGWCRRSSSPCCSRTVRIAFPACVSRMSFCEQSCGAYCSSCTQAAARCDGEGLGASEGADGLGVCQSVRSSGQALLGLGLEGGTRSEGGCGVASAGTQQYVWCFCAAGTAAVEGWSGRLLLGWVRTHTDSQSRVGRNWVGRCPAWAGWGPGGASEGRTFKEQIGLTS